MCGKPRDVVCGVHRGKPAQGAEDGMLPGGGFTGPPGIPPNLHAVTASREEPCRQNPRLLVPLNLLKTFQGNLSNRTPT